MSSWYGVAGRGRTGTGVELAFGSTAGGSTTRSGILVPVGLVDGRDHGFDHGLAIALASDAPLHLLHAVPPDLPFSFRAAERRRRLVALAGQARSTGVTVHVTERHGDPAEVIAMYANAQAVDLVVIGAEPRTGWARLGRSSMAERLLKYTRRPTLVVPPDHPTGLASERVIVAVDRIASLPALVGRALGIVGVRSPRLAVVHVVDSLQSADAVIDPARWLVPEFREQLLGDVRRDLESVIPEGLEIPVHLATGPASEGIEAAAAEIGADLVVIGASRQPLRLGSTAARLVRRAQCALLVLPDDAAAVEGAGPLAVPDTRAA